MEIINSWNFKEQGYVQGMIFDMDGVTFDTMDHVYEWQKLAYDKFGDKTKDFLPYSDEWMENFSDIYAKRSLEGIYNELSHANWEGNSQAIWDAYEKFNAEHPVSTIKNDGVDMADVIQEIYKRGRVSPNKKTRLRLGINTTKSRASLDPLLEQAGIYGCFDSIVAYDDLIKYLADGRAKQEGVDMSDIKALRALIPKGLERLLEKPNGLSSMITMNAMGVQPNRTVVFEDTSNGILAYKPVLSVPDPMSAYVVAVTDGYVKDRQKLIDAGADIILDSRKEFVKVAEMLGGFR